MDHSMHHGAAGASGHMGGGMNGGHGGHGGGAEPQCNMNMLFTWDTTDMCVVFRWWHVRTGLGLLLTLAAVVALAAGYEYLRYQVRILDNEACAGQGLATAPAGGRPVRAKQALGYALQVGYSYLLMLVFMSYNGWVMLAVAAGAGLGFWFWGDKARRGMSCH